MSSINFVVYFRSIGNFGKIIKANIYGFNISVIK